MITLASNLKYLRSKFKFSQVQLADKLSLPRTTLGDYERGKTEPNLEMLRQLADLYRVDVDSLISVDLTDESLTVTKSDDLRILAISVDADSNGNIELVDTKAEAGYLDSFQNPEFIRDLPKISFPNLPHGTYRGFEISGDSMLPLESGSLVICSYVERLSDIKDGQTYVVVTREQGLVYKRLSVSADGQYVTLTSDNKSFAPYQLHMNEIAEVWKHYAHLSFSDGLQTHQSMLDAQMADIHSKVSDLYDRLG